MSRSDLGVLLPLDERGPQNARHLEKHNAVHREEMSHVPPVMKVKNLFLILFIFCINTKACISCLVSMYIEFSRHVKTM